MAEHVAVVDLGSNAVRFVLARVDQGAGFRVLCETRAQIRLGGGPAGRLSRRSIDATLRSVRGFLARIDNGHAPRVLAVATAAVREAANREQLLGPLREREGIAVQVLSGREEARLGALAVQQSLRVRDGVAVDIGGGSLQITRIRDDRIGRGTSLPLGAIRLTRHFLRSDPPTAPEVRALRQEVRDQVLGTLPVARSGRQLVGLGGAVRALARIHLAVASRRRAPRHGLRLAQSEVTVIRERLQRVPAARRRRVPGLKAERADIILAGALVVEELMLFGGYFSLTVCEHRVRDGILWREALRDHG